VAAAAVGQASRARGGRPRLGNGGKGGLPKVSPLRVLLQNLHHRTDDFSDGLIIVLASELHLHVGDELRLELRQMDCALNREKAFDGRSWCH